MTDTRVTGQQTRPEEADCFHSHPQAVTLQQPASGSVGHNYMSKKLGSL